jgi:cysteine desulfurase
MVSTKIYLDNNATTKIAPEVIERMIEELHEAPSNPSSVHFFGQQAKSRLSKARQTIAQHLKVKPTEIVFTSGGTESMNLLIHCFCHTLEKGHILSSSIEHSCVIKSLDFQTTNGWDVTYLPVSEKGCITLDQIEKSLKPNTRMLIFSGANSETGVKVDLSAIATFAEKHHIPLLIDAVALFGKHPFYLPSGVTAAGFSSHKIHGPKGVGFCFLRSLTNLKGLSFGGAQEYSLRPGTENLPGIIGLAAAVELLYQQSEERFNLVEQLRDLFESELQRKAGPILINGSGERVGNVSNICFLGVDGETLLIQLDLNGIQASLGSACSSGSLEPSRVLLSMGISRQNAKSSLRFSLSRFTTKEEILQATDIIAQLVQQIREIS